MSEMFANVILADGRPVCTVSGCNEPIDPGMGNAYFSREKGVMTIVHKSCALGATSLVVEEAGKHGVSVAPVVSDSPAIARKKALYDAMSEATEMYPFDVVARDKAFSQIARDRGLFG